MSGWSRVRRQIFPPSSSMTSSHRRNIQKSSVSFAWSCYNVQRQTSRVQHFDPAAWIILQPAASITAASHYQHLVSDKPPNSSKKKRPNKHKTHSSTHYRWFCDQKKTCGGICSSSNKKLIMWIRHNDESSEVSISNPQERKIIDFF